VTEREWDGCDDPAKMLEALRGKASERKLRLFAVACCRRIWHLLPNARVRNGIEVAERFADGLATRRDLRRAALHCRLVAHDDADEAAGGAAHFASRRVAYAAAERDPGNTKPWHAWDQLDAAESAAQCRLLRCLFGNPVQVDPAWLAWHGGAAGKLAQSVYEERELPSGHLDAARLAVLADMLEEAGCADGGLLGHLRGPGPHVRGCWAVDVLTSRS
jgi:hypothetical protein